jgi:uncharacterized protein YbaP (TraB family)
VRRRLVGAWIFAVLAILPALLVRANAGERHTFLWEARSATTVVYVLGSIHYAKPDMYPLDAGIEDAFSRSHNLVVEADVGNLGSIDIEKLVGNAVYPDDETLKDHVSAETAGSVEAELAELGLPPEMFMKQRPWFLGLTLTSVGLLKMGFDPLYGIDYHFLSEARSGGKKVLELESIAFQIELFSTMSDSEQESFLRSALDDLQLLKQGPQVLLNAWKTGDVKTMERLVSGTRTEDAAMASVIDKLIYRRNARMTEKIRGYLATTDTYFVVVGAAHLVGDRGVIEMLRREGYRVNQL